MSPIVRQEQPLVLAAEIGRKFRNKTVWEAVFAKLVRRSTTRVPVEQVGEPLKTARPFRLFPQCSFGGRRLLAKVGHIGYRSRLP